MLSFVYFKFNLRFITPNLNKINGSKTGLFRYNKVKWEEIQIFEMQKCMDHSLSIQSHHVTHQQGFKWNLMYTLFLPCNEIMQYFSSLVLMVVILDIGRIKFSKFPPSQSNIFLSLNRMSITAWKFYYKSMKICRF